MKSVRILKSKIEKPGTELLILLNMVLKMPYLKVIGLYHCLFKH